MSFLGGVFGSKRKQFGEQALAMVRARPGVVEARFNAGRFEIEFRTQDGMRGRIDLTVAYRRCRGATPTEAARLLFEFVSITPEYGANATHEEWMPRLRPLLRQAGGLDMRVEGQRVADHKLWRPVLPCLMEYVVIDQPTSMQNVHPAQLAEWGVDADTVFAAARGNLAELAFDTLARYDPGTQGGMMHLPDTDGDLYAGSLPLVEGWLAGIGAKAGARPIVFVAENVGVLVGAEFSDQHVLRLLSVARELFDNAVRPVSPVPYTVDAAGALVPYRVERGHPAWREIRSAESTLAAQVYTQQYEYLRADLAAGLIEDRAAQLMHARKPDGSETTFAAWTDTVPTLLPRAHTVTLTDVDTGETFGLPWETLADAVDLRPVEGIHPTRYRVVDHPDAQTMARLRTCARID
ncbi:DUF1444 domain-containing protein [Nocardia otitidiscaviarum]|uniref:hypothetical protein n=1 Tax=Nocardia otitidiscaviarum TaxID=1823 RepID=UPI001894B85A|nr:hypothetical protein [Nocardia otitidiscaviarum]MBF6177606.1 hypothetical protein [Nocardia otitidiscaviarum]